MTNYWQPVNKKKASGEMYTLSQCQAEIMRSTAALRKTETEETGNNPLWHYPARQSTPAALWLEPSPMLKKHLLIMTGVQKVRQPRPLAVCSADLLGGAGPLHQPHPCKVRSIILADVTMLHHLTICVL